MPGYTPFMSDTVEEIFYNISTWKEVLQFPDLASIGEDEISPPALDLMKRLICDPEVRLGKTGAEDIKSHAFFDNFDWRHIRSLTPPFVPKVRNTTRHATRHTTRHSAYAHSLFWSCSCKTSGTPPISTWPIWTTWPPTSASSSKWNSSRRPSPPGLAVRVVAQAQTPRKR